MMVNDDGTEFLTTVLRHGDALPVSDLNPDRAGLEVFGVHESAGNTIPFGTPGSALYDALTALDKRRAIYRRGLSSND